MANRDFIEDGLIEIINHLERQMRDHLLDKRGSVHHACMAMGSNKLPFAHDGD